MSETSQPPIRVLLVDDHAVVRKGMRALLDREPGLEVVGEADDGEQAAYAEDRLRPDVILMDLDTLGMDAPVLGGVRPGQDGWPHPGIDVVAPQHWAHPARRSQTR